MNPTTSTLLTASTISLSTGPTDDSNDLGTEVALPSLGSSPNPVSPTTPTSHSVSLTAPAPATTPTGPAPASSSSVRLERTSSNSSQSQPNQSETQQPPRNLRTNPTSLPQSVGGGPSPWVVQKYGGTSLGKWIENVAEVIVPSYLSRSLRVALVCSARSGDTKSSGTTSLLLRCATEVLRSHKNQHQTQQQNPFYGLSSGLASGVTSGTGTPRRRTGEFGGMANGIGGGTSGRGSIDSMNSRSASGGSPEGRGGEREGYASMRNSLSNLVMSPSTPRNESSTSPESLGGRGETPDRGRDRRHSAVSHSTNGGGDSTASSVASSSSPTSLDHQQQQQQQRPLWDQTVDQIKNDHIGAADKVIRDGGVMEELREDIEWECEKLRSFLMAAQILGEISARSKDIIVGVGERLSCMILCALLRDRGIDSELVSLDTIVEQLEEISPGNEPYQQLGQPFYDRLAQRLGQRIVECEDRVPVITGFFGIVPGSLLSQVGRGYTDLCAALCAVGLSASELQIWKEIDGIFTADPRKVPTARLLPIITPEEAAELTYYGSEVVHPFVMEQVMRASIPIRIKNVENPAGGGTIIYPEPSGGHGNGSLAPAIPPAGGQGEPVRPRPLAHYPTEAYLYMNGYDDQRQRRIPTAVTSKDSIIVVNVRSNRKTISHGFFAKIFETLDKHGIVVDLISTSEVNVSMAIYGGIKSVTLERAVKDLGIHGEVTVQRDMAILSLIGRLKNMVGIAGKMFTTLADGHINLASISQGASEVNISCVIHARDATKAMNLIHHNLLSQSPQDL